MALQELYSQNNRCLGKCDFFMKFNSNFEWSISELSYFFKFNLKLDICKKALYLKRFDITSITSYF